MNFVQNNNGIAGFLGGIHYNMTTGLDWNIVTEYVTGKNVKNQHVVKYYLVGLIIMLLSSDLIW